MKSHNKLHLLFWAIFLPLWCHAQAPTHAGYFIDNQGRRVDCEIELQGWTFNPVDFRYYVPGEAQLRTAIIDSVQAFEVGDYLFERHEVQTDMVVFLQKLTRQEPALYTYYAPDVRRFFLRASGKMLPLDYEQWVDRDGKVWEKSGYREQLMQLAPVSGMTARRMAKVAYRQDELLQYMSQHYQTTSQPAHISGQAGRMPWFHMHLVAGMAVQQSKAAWLQTKGDASTVGLLAGVGLEASTYFSRNHSLSLLLEPTWQQATEHAGWDSYGRQLGMTYHCITLPLQLRYRITLGRQLVGFLQAGVVSSIALSDSEITLESGEEPMGGVVADSFRYGAPTCGIGLASGRMLFDIRYEYHDRIFSTRQGDVSLQMLSARLGYRLF